MAHPYQRELNQRGHLTVASQIAILQLLAQAGGIYSPPNALPPLSESFWRGVAQHTLQQQGLTDVDDPQQLEKSAATLRQAWLADAKTQAMTWQQLEQHNPAWIPMSPEADQAFSEHKTLEWPALLRAIDSYARSNPPLNSVFQPIEPLAMRRHQWLMVESAVSHHNPLLLATHPNSNLLQAAIQQVQTHYQLLEQLEKTLCKQGKSLQARESRLKVVKGLALSPRVASALVDYPVEGFSIGADATQELCGIGALQQGVKRYRG